MKYLIVACLISQLCLAKEITLPKPIYKGNMSVEEAMYKWKATRRFKPDPISLQQLSQLLWSCNGLTIDGISSATRTFPSAGAIYPLDVYIVSGNIKELESGIYKYNHINHSLELVKKGNFCNELAKAALNQIFIAEAPVNFIWVADYEKVNWYGDRGRIRYIHIDLGHSAQNLTLQATALGLATVQVGAFKDEEVKKLLSLPQNKTPVYIMPVGYPKK